MTRLAETVNRIRNELRIFEDELGQIFGGELGQEVVDPRLAMAEQTCLCYRTRVWLRRLSRAGTAAIESATAALLALAVARAGAVLLAGVLVIAAALLSFSTRRRLVLAERSRVGARSEDEVWRALAPLQKKGWRARHSLSWRGREISTPWRSRQA